MALALELVVSNPSSELAQDSDATLTLWAANSAKVCLDWTLQLIEAPASFRRKKAKRLAEEEANFDQLVDRILSRADAAQPPPPARADGRVKVVGQPRRIPVQLLAS
jgi:hypothetical protein